MFLTYVDNLHSGAPETLLAALDTIGQRFRAKECKAWSIQEESLVDRQKLRNVKAEQRGKSGHLPGYGQVNENGNV